MNLIKIKKKPIYIFNAQSLLSLKSGSHSKSVNEDRKYSHHYLQTNINKFFSSLKTNGILHLNVLLLNRGWYMKYRICTLWENINFICSRFGNMTKSEPFVLYLFFVRRKYINVREHRWFNIKAKYIAFCMNLVKIKETNIYI
jgi:hypothetical protein